MKLIIAIIRPERLEAVQAALGKRRVTLTSVGQVLGYGAEPGHQEMYRGAVFETRPAKLRLEMVADDSHVDEAVDAIIAAGATGSSGRLGDGEIFVMQMDECVRICQREREPAATGN